MNHLTATAGLCALLLLFSNCKKDKNEEEDNTIHVLGENYKGGIVAYILQPGDPGFDENRQHGLIMADKDQVGISGVAWGQQAASIPGTLAAVGKGKANTALIVKRYPNAGYAANVCDALTLNGYDDWYLPSKDELFKIYLTKDAIPAIASLKLKYWTSTAGSIDGRAFSVRFEDGAQLEQSTENPTISVRAVRSF